jgi:cell wall-associated NlpC family hydrolase
MFSFGDAHFYGSATGPKHAHYAPVIGMTATPSGHGYRLLTSNGQVFSFGDAHGTAGPTGQLNGRVAVGIAASAKGYWVATSGTAATPADQARKKVVAYAYAQLGKPYVVGGAGPSSFDCSGLSMMAWLQVGVAMQHGSQSQYDSFPHIPLNQLQPGDLVFFGTSGPSNHHVGIVVGNNMMIDAPHTGANVRMENYYTWSDLLPLGARP